MQCLLDVAANCENQGLFKKSDGECPPEGEMKREVPNDDPCSEDCPDTEERVCANDGRTYKNKCELKVAACRDPRITSSYPGKNDQDELGLHSLRAV